MQSAFVGVDQNTASTGMAAVDVEGKFLWSALLTCDPKIQPDVILRSFNMAMYVKAHSKMMHCTVLAFGIEEPIYIQNPKTTIVLSILFGMIYMAASLYTDTIYKIPIADAKYSLTESRKATKKQMVKAAQLQFGLDFTHDEADAIGVALATRSKWLEDKLCSQPGI